MGAHATVAQHIYTFPYIYNCIECCTRLRGRDIAINLYVHPMMMAAAAMHVRGFGHGGLRLLALAGWLAGRNGGEISGDQHWDKSVFGVFSRRTVANCQSCSRWSWNWKVEVYCAKGCCSSVRPVRERTWNISATHLIIPFVGY